MMTVQPSTAQIDDLIESTQADIAQMKQRRAIIETEIAGAWDTNTAKLTGEHSALGVRIQAGEKRLAQFADQRKEVERCELLTRYEQLAAEQHTAYTRMAELDAAVKAHQEAIEAANKEYTHLKTGVTTNYGRMGKIQSRLGELAINHNTLEQIRRKFPTIEGYWS